MKTTVDISDALLRQAKAIAHERGTTLRALIEDGLQRVLADKPAKKFRLRDGSVGGKTPVPGLRENDWRQMRAFAYGSHLGYPDDATPEEIDRIHAAEDAKASAPVGKR